METFNLYEASMYSELFDYLGWEVDEDNKILKDGFIPLTIGNKTAIQYADYNRKQLKEFENKYTIFRPLKIRKHCAVLMEHVMFMYDELEGFFSRQDNEPNVYLGTIKYTDDEEDEIKGVFDNENECRFNLCYSYLTNTDGIPLIKQVNAFDKEARKASKPSSKEKKKKESNENAIEKELFH